jgi:hypothetical protein
MKFHEAKQVVKSALKRLFGRPQPTRTEILLARQRVETGVPGSVDGGDPGRDYCLARGFCCERGCRACPWGHRARST